VVDAANVMGSRPDGWWRDRAGAAARLVADLRQGVRRRRLPVPVVVVVEGRARSGAPPGTDDAVSVVHAEGAGDDAIVEQVALARAGGVGPTTRARSMDGRADVAAAAPGAPAVVVVTADRALGRRVRALGAAVVGPRWLWHRLGR
jgi:hypothetical protein